MELRSIEFSQVARSIRVSYPGGAVYIPDFVQRLNARYGFLKFPSSLDEFDFNKGAFFYHGKFVSGSQPITIDRLGIFQNAVLAETRARVEDAELFLEDAVSWAIQQYGIIILDEPIADSIFTSSIEVKMQFDIEANLSTVNRIGGVLAEKLRSYGVAREGYVPAGFTLHYDTAAGAGWKQPAFTVERRLQQPYWSNIYYSTAPLRTHDHLEILNQLESSAV